MNPEDKEKTTFVTRKMVFCYEVMPFGLKNARLTYQRLVTKLFERLIRKDVEAFINDIMVKSVDFLNHFSHLKLVFKRQRRHRVKLDPSKCKFVIASRVFLGHVINKKRI